MSAVPPQLQHLALRIGRATGLAPDAVASEVKAALPDATTEPGWLPAERRRADHQRYARHLLYGDPGGRISILSLVRDRARMSPIHAHHCWCAVIIRRGMLTETYYREVEVGEWPVEIGSARHAVGASTFDPGSRIHRLAHVSGVPAISLHGYGVAADRVSSGVNRIHA